MTHATQTILLRAVQSIGTAGKALQLAPETVTALQRAIVDGQVDAEMVEYESRLRVQASEIRSYVRSNVANGLPNK